MQHDIQVGRQLEQAHVVRIAVSSSIKPINVSIGIHTIRCALDAVVWPASHDSDQSPTATQQYAVQNKPPQQ